MKVDDAWKPILRARGDVSLWPPFCCHVLLALTYISNPFSFDLSGLIIKYS